MQHHAPYGYVSPASPRFDAHPKCIPQQPQQQFHASRHFQPARCIPLAPEERLGSLLDGKLQLTEILGTGAYGVVYLALDIETGVRYAVKCLSKFNPDGTPLERRQVAYQQREIRLHYLASAHRNVVQMLKIVDQPDCIYVILEYCPEGDLFLNITERGQYVGKDELSKNVFLQILDAVEHCHNLGIYHRDLKPENILVTDRGDTVKLADFGLATSDDRSEDYGCGSTFYMSPECLDPSTRKPFYMCAPNDIWSLGVILVNLTCGRNPWKQASFQDSTYRAYARSQDFLKTILPLTDDLNDILGRIFNPIPEHRITIRELRNRILACPKFTMPAMATTASITTAPPTPNIVTPPSPPATPEHMTPKYVANTSNEDAIIDDYDYNAPLSPVSSSSDDEGSLTSSGSTIDDLDDDFIQEQQQEMITTAQDYATIATHTFESDEQLHHHHQQQQQQQPIFHTHELVPQIYSGPVPVSVSAAMPQQMHHCQQVPVQVPVHQVQHQAPMGFHTVGPGHQQQQQQQQQQPLKSYFPLWDVVKYVQHVPILQHHVPFHQQVPIMPTFQGCY